MYGVKITNWLTPVWMLSVGISIGFLLVLIGLVTVASGVYGVRHTACSRCLNFSCPGNTVHKQVVDAYLRRNPVMRAAWEASGYRLEE